MKAKRIGDRAWSVTGCQDGLITNAILKVTCDCDRSVTGRCPHTESFQSILDSDTEKQQIKQELLRNRRPGDLDIRYT